MWNETHHSYFVGESENWNIRTHESILLFNHYKRTELQDEIFRTGLNIFHARGLFDSTTSKYIRFVEVNI
ncbi:hypothetical protein AVEN_230579-1 [Araneus ventricosus]|uniref:Uncharacterized protein n=1 Tax=Araneus ventricosus TaxID=182803 RepID=A0A4Y2LIX4_ARAVE|nr:hypothetical protein AVEN_230579-1 [Araneus ventricosus]